MSIPRRTLMAKLGMILPAAALLTATSARAATEDGTATGATASHHSAKKHSATNAHKHKSGAKPTQNG